MPPSSTELVLFQPGGFSDLHRHNIPWSPSSPRGNSLAKSDVLGVLLTSWGPNLFSTSLLGHLRTRPQNSSGFNIAINVIKAQFILFRRRIDALESQNDDLRHDNIMCHSDVGALESDLTNLRAEYYSELFQRRQETRKANEDKEEIRTLKAELMMKRTEVMILNDKIAQAEIFIQAMVDLKLHDPVLQAAYQSVKDGGEAEDAIVNAILKASARKDSVWSRIIPAVIGPRTPEHYISALDLALNARRELQERRKVYGFWKLKAMADPSNANTITPSSSQISDICQEMMQLQQVSKDLKSSNPRIKAPDTELENAAVAAEFQSIKTVIQLTENPAEDQGFQSDDSDSYSMDEDRDDEAYLSEPESITSSATIKPLNTTKNQSVDNDALDVSEPAGLQHTFGTIQDAESLNKEFIAEMPSTPLPTEVSFIVEPFMPSKSPQSSKVSSFLPATLLRNNSRKRPTLSPKSASPPTFLAKSRAVEQNTTSRANPDLFVPPVKSGATTSPIRSRLSTPKNKCQRPVLQNINLNVPSSPGPRLDKDERDPGDDDEVSSSHNLRRSSTRDLRKRRGVIMVERTTAVTTDPNVPSPNERVSDSPELLATVPDTDVFSCEDLAPQVAEEDEFGGHLAQDASDIEQSPVLSAAAEGTEDELVLPLSQDKDTQMQRPAVPSPSSLIISRFVENFSDSDLGSLEMTEDENSDSDCENIRSVKKNLPPAKNKRTIRYSDEGDDDVARCSGHLSASISNKAVVSALASSESATPSVASASRSRPATPFSKSLSWISKNKKDKDRASLSASTSDSSYTTSTSGSDGQTSKKKAKLPLLGLARRFGRTSTSPPPTNEIDASSALPTSIVASTPISDNNESTPPPTTDNSASKPITSFWNKRNSPSNNAAKETNPTTPTKTISPSKIPKSDSAQKRTPVAGLRPSVGQSFIRRLSNLPSPKSKASSKPTPQPMNSSSAYISPLSKASAQHTPQSALNSSSAYLSPSSPGQHTKPRSHTINTVSPLPPSLSTPSPQSLMAGSTKPRSHTVNTYSPTTRSPLSRLAGDTSTDDKSTPTKTSRNLPGSPLPKSLVPKPISSPKHTVKNTAPRANKISKKNLETPHDTEPKPPTAAFMRPAATSATSTRRMTNSIAPLIPNWTPSTTNGLTPKQCRSMFRNSLSMVVR